MFVFVCWILIVECTTEIKFVYGRERVIITVPVMIKQMHHTKTIYKIIEKPVPAAAAHQHSTAAEWGADEAPRHPGRETGHGRPDRGPGEHRDEHPRHRHGGRPADSHVRGAHGHRGQPSHGRHAGDRSRGHVVGGGAAVTPHVGRPTKHGHAGESTWRGAPFQHEHRFAVHNGGGGGGGYQVQENVVDHYDGQTPIGSPWHQNAFRPVDRSPRPVAGGRDDSLDGMSSVFAVSSPHTVKNVYYTLDPVVPYGDDV